MEKLRKGKGVPHARAPPPPSRGVRACLLACLVPSIETLARVLRAIWFLGSVFRDCSPVRSSSSTPANWDRDRLHLLPGGRSGLRLLRLLPGGRSRDYTANIFLHRLWSTTASNALCRLVRMEPPVPSALVPPRGTILNDCFSLSVCLL